MNPNTSRMWDSAFSSRGQAGAWPPGASAELAICKAGRLRMCALDGSASVNANANDCAEITNEHMAVIHIGEGIWNFPSRSSHNLSTGSMLRL